MCFEYEGEDKDCKPKPFVKKKPKAPTISYVDFDNRPLKPEEVEFIKLLPRKIQKLQPCHQSAILIRSRSH